MRQAEPLTLHEHNTFDPAKERLSCRGSIAFTGLSEIVAELKADGEPMRQIVEELFDAAEVFHALSRHHEDPTVSTDRLHIIDAVVNGRSIAAVFPEYDLSQAACRMLEVWVSAETATGLGLQDYAEQLATPEGRMTRAVELVADLTQEQQQAFYAIFNNLDTHEQKLLASRLDGKTNPEIAAMLRADLSDITHSFRGMRRSIERNDLLKTKLPAAPYDKRPTSLLKDIRVYLEVIDDTCRYLQSHQPAQVSLDAIAYSLLEHKVTARTAAIILRDFLPHGSNLHDDLPGSKKSHNSIWKGYRKNFGDLVYAYRSIDRRRSGLPPPYEESDEARQMIHILLARRDQERVVRWRTGDKSSYPLLTSEEEGELAMRIEAGMWAEMRLALEGDEPERKQVIKHLAKKVEGFDPQPLEESLASLRLRPFSEDDLKEYAADGREAFIDLMDACTGLVIKYTKLRLKDDYPLTAPDKMVAGLQGVMRAIRKFDYKLGYKLSVSAVHWIVNFTQRQRHKSYEGVPSYIVRDWEQLMAKRDKLTQELGTTAITDKQLAEAVGFTLERTRKAIECLDLYFARHPEDEVSFKNETQTEPAAQHFKPETLHIFNNLFAGKPLALKVLTLCFEDEYTIKQVSELTKVPPEVVKQHLDYALNELRDYLGTPELDVRKCNSSNQNQ